MPFENSVRSWWLRVQNNQCQYRYFNGDKLTKCNNEAHEVHHLVSESFCLENGLNPNEAPGLALCRKHHRYGLEQIMEPHGSFHPDMAIASELYRQGVKTAFKDASRVHHESAKKGVDLWEGSWREIEFYIQGLLGMANIYIQEHPEDPKPNKRHSKIMKPKKWYDIF